ncbi:MAG: YeeE/YedE family protein [Alphaproteobacteria bacterium]|nr:YeeE/YedE family protein [Alphaproteobacteria bacterium]
MNISLFILTGLSMGIVFGFALEKSRVFEPGIILGQFQLRNFIMLKVFLTASATGLLALALLNGTGTVALHPKATFYLANLIGGLIFGAGMAFAGACPGTVLAQIGAGYKDAWAVLIGGIAGAIAFGYFYPEIKPELLTGGPGKVTYADLTGVPFWLLALIAAALLIAVLAALERWRPWESELGDDFDGMVPAAESKIEVRIER